MWVRVEGERCLEIISFDPTGLYPPVLLWVAVPEELQPFFTCDYRHSEGRLAPPTPAYLRDQIAGRLAARRWRAEESGVRVTLSEGRVTPVTLVVDTSREARGNLLSAVLAAQLDAGMKASWKDAQGQFALVTAAEILTMASAALRHVLACFAHEAALYAAMEAAPDQAAMLTCFQQLDDGWPQ